MVIHSFTIFTCVCVYHIDVTYFKAGVGFITLPSHCWGDCWSCYQEELFKGHFRDLYFRGQICGLMHLVKWLIFSFSWQCLDPRMVEFYFCAFHLWPCSCHACQFCMYFEFYKILLSSCAISNHLYLPFIAFHCFLCFHIAFWNHFPSAEGFFLG